MSAITSGSARGVTAGGSTSLVRGVSSAARLRATPLVLASAHDARVVGIDGREYADFVLAMGPMLLGHARREILDRAAAQLRRGTMFGTTTAEFALADNLSRILPHAESVAFVNSGSEATHLALRIARAKTGRRLIVKFEGHYHGWIDPLFVNTQNNAASDPAVARVAPVHSVAGQDADPAVIVIRWNDPDEVRRVFAENLDTIAAVIVEPVPMNFGTLLPDPEFSRVLRDETRRAGSLLIFDEVLSGFRLALGGAAELLGLAPDIAVYAKAIANGFPLAAVVGTCDAFEPIISGPMLPAGTYSGNPVSVEASLATLQLLEEGRDTIYSELDRRGRRLAAGIESIAVDTGAPLSVHQVGSVLQLFWGAPGPIRSYADADRSDRATITKLCEGQLEKGALVSGRGLVLLSAAHTDADIDSLVAGLRDSVRDLV